MVSRLNHWNLDYNRTIAVAPQQQQTGFVLRTMYNDGSSIQLKPALTG